MSAIGADHLQLRCVKMRVDETGRDQMTGQVNHRTIADFLSPNISPWTGRRDPACRVDGKKAILMVPVGPFDPAGERITDWREESGTIDLYRGCSHREMSEAWDLILVALTLHELLEDHHLSLAGDDIVRGRGVVE
jgi:hypothetical protein